MITLHKPIPVTIKNMSANGVLFKGNSGCLDVGMQLQLYMDVTDSGMRYEYKVVRKQNSNPETEEYGCNFVFFLFYQPWEIILKRYEKRNSKI